MEWKTITKEEAKRRVSEWKTDPAALPRAVRNLDAVNSGSLNETYRSLRTDLSEAFFRIRDAIRADRVKAADYVLDLDFGLYLYQKVSSLGLSPRTASYDGIWVYLSVAVIPDVVYERYGTLSEDRYFAKKRRIWLKSLWWYIYLSLQQTNGKDDLQKTREILLHNSTDTILQLVDRAGTGGYRTDFTRELMRRYAEYTPDPSGVLLRKVMTLHVAKARVMEPELAEGGIPGYVSSLLEYFNER